MIFSRRRWNACCRQGQNCFSQPEIYVWGSFFSRAQKQSKQQKTKAMKNGLNIEGWYSREAQAELRLKFN